MHLKNAAVGLVGVAVALTMSACTTSADAESDTAGDNAAYCQSSTVAQAEVEALKALVARDVTVNQVAEQRDTVLDAVAEARDDAVALAQSVRNQIELADEAFTNAVQAIPGDARLSEATAAYNAAVDAWNASLLAIRSEVGCP